MTPGKLSSKVYRQATSKALSHGEIISNLIQFRIFYESLGNSPSISTRPYPHAYAIVCTQGCDLVQDFNARTAVPNNESQKLPSILLCETFVAEELRAARELNSKLWKDVRNNNNKRYHYLAAVDARQDAIQEGLPSLCVDFKRYFCLQPQEMYDLTRSSGPQKALRRCQLRSPYLEHFSDRFAHYQARVGLPQDHYLK